LNLKKFLI